MKCGICLKLINSVGIVVLTQWHLRIERYPIIHLSTMVVNLPECRLRVIRINFNAFAFFPHLHKEFDITDQENKENPKFKTWRNKI